MATVNLTAQRLREVLSYDPETGEFAWLKNFGSRARAGQSAGTNSRGYLVIRVDRKLYFAHRLAWLHSYGHLPASTIDHINGDKADNRLVNLRDVTHSVNMQNIRSPSGNNKSGLLGVIFYRDRWQADILANGTRHCLGRFETPEEAHSAYVEAKRKLHEGCTI